jgi:uncharacterized protein YjbI with pentapeptide repeats
MSVSIDYWTTTKIKPNLQRRLDAAAAEFVRGRRWWAESLGFFAWPGKEGHVAGSTKFSRSDADPEDDMFMAGVDMLAILEKLAAWSAEYAIDWDIQLAGEKWGTIRHGEFDAPLKKFCTETRKSLGKPAQAAKRSADIFSEYDGETVPAPAAKNVKQLQERWTAKQVNAINAFITVSETYEEMKKGNVTPVRELPVKLVPTYEDAGITWRDLRGFPLNRCNAISADHADFSFCKAARPKQKKLPGLDIIMTNCRFTDCRFIQAGPFYSCGHEFLRCDFTGAKLRGAILVDRVFRECNFAKADLGRIQAYAAKFEKCLFEGTRFCKVELDMTTKFIDCVFRGCDWTGANLPCARFKGCDLRGENLAGTDCPRTAFDKGCQIEGITLE